MNRMWEAVTCTVCSEVYQAGTREPLVLPCGHTFCRTCVASFRKMSSFSCPTCRHVHGDLEEDQLYVSFSLLSLASEYEDAQVQRDTCSEHGDNQRYWCFDCKLQLCSLCLYSGHPPGHNIKLVTTYVIEKKQALKAQLETVTQEIESLQKNVKINFSGFLDEVVMCLSELCQVHNSLQDFQDSVTQILDKVKKDNKIKVIEVIETELHKFQAQLQEYTKPDKEDRDCSVTYASTTDDTLTTQSVKESDASPGIHQEIHPSTETVNTAAVVNKQEKECVNHDTLQDEESVHFNTNGNITEDQKNPADRSLTTSSEEKKCDFRTKDEVSLTTVFQFGQKVSLQGFEFFKSHQVKDKLTNDNMHRFSGLRNAWTSPVYGFPHKKMSVKNIATQGLPADMENRPVEGSQENDGVKSTRLDYQDGRLLLHCLGKPTETCLSLQLPYEVFLELSAGDKSLGLVYISLWSQLRRAQQLLALCLGTLGPSYLGARGRVLQTSAGKYLSFSCYQSSDGCESSQHIFTDLEWGGTYIRPTKEGLVMHSRSDDDFSCTRPPTTEGLVTHSSRLFGSPLPRTTGHDKYETFSICIENNNESLSTCPFGEVVAGMEVLKTAATQKESTITITQCGLVLPCSIKQESEQPSSLVSSSRPVQSRRCTGKRSYFLKCGRGRRR